MMKLRILNSFMVPFILFPEVSKQRVSSGRRVLLELLLLNSWDAIFYAAERVRKGKVFPTTAAPSHTIFMCQFLKRK